MSNRKMIGGIYFNRVLRFDSLGIQKILFYRVFYLTNFKSSLWVAISNDNGKSWIKYFTGLVEDNFYHVKPNPTIRLIKNDSTIQLEIAIIRQMKEEVRPGPAPEEQYELVQDNLVHRRINKCTFCFLFGTALSIGLSA